MNVAEFGEILLGCGHVLFAPRRCKFENMDFVQILKNVYQKTCGLDSKF